MSIRKQHVGTTTETVILAVEQAGIASVAEVADALAISTGSARRHLDGGVARGALIRDEYDAEGCRLTHTNWRYALRD